jgi:steroid 5-alpha reductase family enzyme
MNPTPLVVLGTLLAMSIMVVVWIFAKRMNNAGIVDIWWSYSFAPVAVFYGLFGSGHALRNSLIAAMVCAWSIRLGTHLYKRVMAHHPDEDPRYAALRTQFPKNTWLMFFGFFQLQAVLIGLLSIPVAIACVNPVGGVRLFEVAGLVLWLVAIAGESIADTQLALFRASPANKGRVCDFGLWKYSRHPNYFFEWLVWVAYFVFALGSPWGWVGIISPALMLYFLTCVTGIRPSEEQSLKSRGDAYRRYQERTSPFIPWFPKNTNS